MAKKFHIEFKDGRSLRLPVRAGKSLAQVLFLHGVWPGLPLCSGLGRCGRCRVRFLDAAPDPVDPDRRFFSAEEIARGWRLACRHEPGPGDRVLVPELPDRSYRPHVLRKTPPRGAVGLAVDVGTTSIDWAAVDEESRFAAGTALNPQLGAGSEIMSRLSMAEDRDVAEFLQKLAVEVVRGACNSLPIRPGRLAVAGNPAMIYLLLGLPTGGLARAPYGLDYLGSDERELAPDLPPAYIPPLLAPFVGADISAGLAAVRFSLEPGYPYILADMGTNGEFVLAVSENEFLAASVPLGPALEGVGLTFGTPAGPGSVTAVEITPQGFSTRRLAAEPGFKFRDEVQTQDTGFQAGLTGTGYLSLLAALLKTGVLGRDGQFGPGNSPLGQKLAERTREVEGEKRFCLDERIYLPARDVEEILKVKSAFNYALSGLLKQADLSVGEIKALYLAGALGAHVRVSDLDTLGFIPGALSDRVCSAGNTSLTGAELALTEPKVRAWLAELPGRTTPVDLTEAEDFGSSFVQRMVFEYV